MHYAWRYRQLSPSSMVTADGRRVDVIDPGRLNTDSGPDFFNAKLRIGDQMWVGDVEMHLRASDWHRHGHDGDPAYESVVLHVVDCDDVPIRRQNGEVIPQMVMKIHPEFHARYAELVSNAGADLPCGPRLCELPSLHLTDWLTSLGFERLHAKADRLAALTAANKGDWEETAYITLARALGFGTNSEPMERLALATPMAFIRGHADSLLSVEALLFGQSGLLALAPEDDDYTARLREEYHFLAHKFSLTPLQNPGWKMGRMRPASFPHRRIAILAAMLTHDFRLTGRILACGNAEDAMSVFDMELSAYWSNHFHFGASAQGSFKALSKSSLQSLVINTAAPLMAAIGRERGDDAMVGRAVEWLEQLPPEHNRLTAPFDQAGLLLRDAFTSQALIQARRAYCEPRRCIYCRLGHRIMARK